MTRPAVEIVDAPDPDAPNRTIRRARRVDPLLALALSDREWAAALRFRDEADLANPYATGEGVGGRAHWQRSGLPAAQLDAITSLTGAHMAIGPICSPVVCAVVLEWQPIRAVAKGGAGRKAAEARLRLGLARLIDYYG